MNPSSPVYFYPGTNFIHDFPVQGRPLLCTGKTGKLDFLANCFDCKTGYTDVPEEKPFLLFGSPSELAWLDECYASLPANFRELQPSSWIVLLPDEKFPAIWIGGKSASDAQHALLLAEKTFPVLRHSYAVAGDFHLHSNVSDGDDDPRTIPSYAVEAGLDIAALTDHNTDDGWEDFRQAAKPFKNFLAMRGMEITDSESNHVLAIGDVTGLQHADFHTILAAARSGRVFIAQAHATSKKWFTPLNEDTYVATEAFNFLSSAPATARKYLQDVIEAGKNVAALGNSDAHSVAFLGKAKTFMLLEKVSSDDVLNALKMGKCCAGWQGEFYGEKEIADFFRMLYWQTNLLDGKLLPTPDVFYSQTPPIESKENDTFNPCKPLPPAAKSDFCRDPECHCKEARYSLSRSARRIIAGDRHDVIMELDKQRFPVSLRSGSAVDLRKFCKVGANRLFCKKTAFWEQSARVCFGHEITDIALRLSPEDEFSPIEPAANLQIQGILPVNFAGSMTFRLRIDNQNKFDRLFFESVDGNIDIYVGDKLLAQRSNAHWEDRFEVAVPPLTKLEIRIELNTYCGLTGISNKVFHGRSIDFSGDYCNFELPENMDFVEIRYGTPRTRMFVLDEAGKTVRKRFADGSMIEMPPGASEVIINSIGQQKIKCVEQI